MEQRAERARSDVIPLTAAGPGSPAWPTAVRRVEDLLRDAAQAAPDRIALHAQRTGAEVTYRELDARASAFAQILRRRLDGAQGRVVALTAVFDPAFAVAYYGIVRSGNIVAVVNPLLREEGLQQVLSTCAARLAVVSPEACARVESVRAALPHLAAPDAIVRTDELDALPAAAADPGWAEVERDPEAVACIQFTSGTTGTPKAVQLTHRNLTANAAQTARAHGLTASSVMLNYLPSFHPMHLNLAVCAGATQVLCTDEDILDSLATADRYAATHYYSLPVRLARLAADPRLPGVRLKTVGALLSGGSALAPATAAALSEHFGIPVVQGYGLAEASPSTHFDRLERPKPGSCGPVVEGTECRIVDIDTRAPLPAGERGEIQVRGPQLMRGYLGEHTASAFDEEGWFSSGDVGLIDEDGYLFVVDRIKDVFKRDNWLVAPAEIERVLARHPAVADCVVVDYPDPFSGAVAHALVVASDPDASAAEIAAFVNGQVPYYQHLREVELTDRIQRSANGKIQRHLLREQLRARAAARATDATPPQAKDRENTMVTLVNRLTVTGCPEEFEKLLAGITEIMKAQPGFQSHQLYRSLRNPNVYVEVAQWSDAGAHKAAMQNPGFGANVAKLKALASAEPDLFAEVVEEPAVAAG